MQARKSAGERSTLALKPMRKDTRIPKQEQSVAPQNGHLSNKNFYKKKKKRKEKKRKYLKSEASSVTEIHAIPGEKIFRIVERIFCRPVK